jgi:hypothetical protein
MLSITFEFVGGPKDGHVVEGTLGDSSDAERYYLFSHRGAVGNRFKVPSQYAVDTLASEELKDDRRHYFQQHFYVVTNRREEDDHVWVRAEYVPEAVESSGPSS